MKRDMDVVRRIVLALQDADSTLNGVEGVEQAIFLEHARLLVDEGLAEGHILVTGVPPKAQVANLFRLTWAGQDFADASKDETVWEKAKKHVLKPGVSWTFALLLEWLKVESKKRLFGPE
jgi:hypothetical protein